MSLTTTTAATSIQRKHLVQYGTLPTLSSLLDIGSAVAPEIEAADDDNLEEQKDTTKLNHYANVKSNLQQHRTTLLINNILINICNWYAFATFGYLSDVLGNVFFENKVDDDVASSSSPLVQSFAVFGVSFLVRPIGGLLFGYLGDRISRHVALVSSVLLMAIATIIMGCLPPRPSYSGWLISMRVCQGLAAGGQLMSSLVFGVESYPNRRQHWGFVGSLVLSAANFGNFLSGVSVYWLRRSLSQEQLERWGWKVTHLLSGSLLLLCGLWLQNIPTHENEPGEKGMEAQQRPNGSSVLSPLSVTAPVATTTVSMNHHQPQKRNPLLLAFAPQNRRAFLAACMVPVLGSAGFWLTFVWMSIYMFTLSPHPLANAFGINALAQFLGVILFFPLAGHVSDRWGRRTVMTVGGVSYGVSAPLGLWIISQGNPWFAFAAQLTMGLELSLWCAPMAAWLAEAFEPEMRLTSVAVAYNLGVGIFSGIAPATATSLVENWGYQSASYVFVLVSAIGLTGLLVVAPTTTSHHHGNNSVSVSDDTTILIDGGNGRIAEKR